MEIFLRGLLPRILGDLSFEIYPSQSKTELLRDLPERLRGYARWLPKTWRVVILIDRDLEDCHDLKRRLEAMASDSGLVTRSTARDMPYAVANRIVIEELEAWYFGDWEAVCEAYPRVPKTIYYKMKYRDPDDIRGGTSEAFERILKKAGYFVGGLRKVEAARVLSKYVEPVRSRSGSFRVFHGVLLEILGSGDSA